MRIGFLRKSLLVFTLYCLWSSSYSQTTNDFGTTDRISNGLEGKIFALPTDTKQLPDFDTMTSLGTIYTKQINIPGRSWTSGFPGVTDRFEWFGIEYNGTFTVKKTGRYTFTLLSDDGSKLFIDDSLVINNDGVHAEATKENAINLDGSKHKIKIQYFQGPRAHIALQLFAKLDNETRQIFPGDNFILTTPGSSTIFPSYLIWIAAIILILFLIIFIRRRKRRTLHADN